MKSIAEYSAIVNAGITRFEYDEPKSLYEPISYTMAGGGKRLRPVLTLAVADALDADVEDALRPALGVELYHNFTLLHDDIMDNSPTRRGRQAVWKKWDIAQAILSGDTMFSVAIDCILNSCYGDSQRISLIECFNKTALAVDCGQQYDMDFERREEVSVDEYINMISLKTGALLAGACRMGAICGNATSDICDAFHSYGINLGIAFQIQDDILDVYGDEKTLGKPIGGDILNDKHTWLHITAMSEAHNKMSAVYAQGLEGEEKINAIRAIYDELSLRNRSERQVEHYMQLAVDAIDRTKLRDEVRKFFTEFAYSLIGRKK